MFCVRVHPDCFAEVRARDDFAICVEYVNHRQSNNTGAGSGRTRNEPIKMFLSSNLDF